MRKLVVLLALFGLSATGRSQATPEYESGAFLMKSCRDAIAVMESKEAPWGEASYCFGYIDGAVEFVNIAGYRVCFPQHFTKSTVIRIVVKWMEDRPKYLDKPQRESVDDALATNYPCPTSLKKPSSAGPSSTLPSPTAAGDAH